MKNKILGGNRIKKPGGIKKREKGKSKGNIEEMGVNLSEEIEAPLKEKKSKVINKNKVSSALKNLKGKRKKKEPEENKGKRNLLKLKKKNLKGVDFLKRGKKEKGPKRKNVKKGNILGSLNRKIDLLIEKNPVLEKAFGIKIKLTMAFMIPVVLIVILGISSYSRSSKTIVTNYRESTTNTVQKAGE